jgi:hypothetical protein
MAQSGQKMAARAPASDSSAALAQRDPHRDDEDLLDPLERRRAALAPPDQPPFCASVAVHEPLVTTGAQPTAESGARAAPSLEDLLPALVRRIAWSGDRHRGTVRLELGAGELAGGTLLVYADAGRVRVHLDVPPGVDTRRWQQRIRDRLASRGVVIDAVDVT